jgi:hypothetical protein
MIPKICTQIKLICIAVGFTKPHVPMGGRGCCTLVEWTWIPHQSPSSLIGLKKLKATRWLKNIYFTGFSNGYKARHFLYPNYFAKSFPTPRGHLFGQWQNQREIADQNGRSGSELGKG